MQKEFNGHYLISTDKNLLNLDVIYHFISTSYWAGGVSREIVEKSVNNALCFGVYDNSVPSGKKQIGFARVITDLATFGYLADVFIIDGYQGQGLGKLLVQFILDYPELQNLRRLLLGTRDAHSLYEKFGFKPMKNPQNFMEIHKPDLYKKN
jgi:GNAT superfamily N-acetyltransferase